MASVLIITTILNIVVSVFVNSEKQSSQRLSNSQLQHNDQKDVDRRMDTISGWNQVKREQPNSNMFKNQPLNERKKRQILFLVNRRPAPEALFRMPKTTQNPFIRETNVDEYDIGGPAEIEHVPQGGDSSSRIDSHQLVKMAQHILKFYQQIKAKIDLSYPIKNVISEIKTEDTHVRIKRKMSEFRRDRKQITRKKKIGRRKKTKVKRLAVKKRKWYDKRLKVEKKGDGTYRGGRGRVPRQHKRPRHYKPPKNESSVYDYYDDDGKVKVAPGETQEGSEAAEYVEYGTGEYADTAEAEAAQQEMEKEYQMQLVRERKRRLMNGTVGSDEFSRHSNESEYGSSYSDSGGDVSEYDTEYEEDGTDEDESEEKESSDDDGGSPKKNNKTPEKQVRPKRELEQENSDVRLIAKRLHVMSLSDNPILQNSLNTKQIPIENKMSSVQFAEPSKYKFQNIKSIPKQCAPDVASITKSEITSMGGTEMHNLQSKRSSVDINTASRGIQLTSIAGDKPKTAMVFTSSSKDSQPRITSMGQEHFRAIQSIAVKPLVLTSEAKYVPDFSKEEKSNKKAREEVVNEVKGVKRNILINKKIDLGRQKNRDIQTNLEGINLKNGRFIRSSPISKQKFSGSYEELASVPDGVGTSVSSDEIEPANDSETSELEYESGYTISMSDSEDWENYPLTTPSGPNPGWRLSTLADIYQRQRVKRAPKEKKRKIGAYKEKLKERRKRKENRRKMRIIRNSKEDKEVKELLMKHEGDEEVEKLLVKPWYKQQRVKKDSKHVLWSNETHRIVEDQGATFKWINKTHYAIYKENVTDDWYNKEHVLVYDEDWDSNNTLIEKHEGPSSNASGNPEVGDADFSEERSENLTKEEEASKANDKRKKKQNSKQNKTKKKSNVKKQKSIEDRGVKRKEQGDKKDTSSKNTSKISLGWENQIVDESES